MRPSFGAFASWLLRPFFKWWWGAITGLASLLAFFQTPSQGLFLTKLATACLVLTLLVLLFLVLSVGAQGWKLFADRNRSYRVTAIRKSTDFGGDWVILLEGPSVVRKGLLLNITRDLDNIEVPFALVQVIGTTAGGLHQATPIWMSPAQLTDFVQHRFATDALLADGQVDSETVERAFRDLV